jgi:Lipocalin-like domain
MFYIIVILAGIFAMPASAQGIVGTWQITSFSLEYQDTKEVAHPINQPTGYLQYSPGGHMVTFVAAGDLPRLTTPTYTDGERATIVNQIIGAYAGTYRIEGDKVIHHVLNAWFPPWIGTDQIRYFKIDGKNLAIKTAPITSATNGRQIVSTLAFERVE